MGQITEIKLIEIGCIPENPFYLRWINTHGAVDHFLFGVNQLYKTDIKNGERIRVNFTDYENQSVISKLIKKEAVDEIELVAYDLSQSKVQALKGLLKSNFVQMLVTNGTPPVFKNVIVKPGSYDIYNTKLNIFNFEVTIELPETFVQVN